MLEGIFGGSQSGALQPFNMILKDFNSSLQLTRRIDGTQEVFLLAVQATTNNDDCVASMIWEEYN
jgi:hypothetical protein